METRVEGEEYETISFQTKPKDMGSNLTRNKGQEIRETKAMVRKTYFVVCPMCSAVSRGVMYHWLLQNTDKYQGHFGTDDRFTIHIHPQAYH